METHEYEQHVFVQMASRMNDTLPLLRDLKSRAIDEEEHAHAHGYTAVANCYNTLCNALRDVEKTLAICLIRDVKFKDDKGAYWK